MITKLVIPDGSENRLDYPYLRKYVHTRWDLVYLVTGPKIGVVVHAENPNLGWKLGDVNTMLDETLGVTLPPGAKVILEREVEDPMED
jgi:hypothetical protein